MSLLENENYDLAENEENIKDDATFDNSNKGGNKKSNKNEKMLSGGIEPYYFVNH